MPTPFFLFLSLSLSLSFHSKVSFDHHPHPPSSLLRRPCCLCFSATKVNDSSCNNNAASSNRNHKCSATSAAAASPELVMAQKKQPSQGQRWQVLEELRKNPRAKDKAGARRQGTHVPCGKRTNFGYEKDFENGFWCWRLVNLFGVWDKDEFYLFILLR